MTLETCKRVLVVDVDPGIDDAFALLILLAAHKLNLICLSGIVCSLGNVKRDQSCENLASILTLLNANNDSYPITYFEGSPNYMIKPKEFSNYFGIDGLGDVADRPVVNTDHFKKFYEFQEFMSELTKKFPKKVSLMTLGPLTVAATLLMQQPDIDLKDIWIMGGNDIDRDDFTEWNFYVDPHAANITLNRTEVPTYITTFQACENVIVPMSWRNNSLGAVNTPFMDFMNKAELNFYNGDVPDQWTMYDPVVAAAFVNNRIIQKKSDFGVEVYLGEEREKGLLVKGLKNVIFIEKLDAELYQKTILGAAQVFL